MRIPTIILLLLIGSKLIAQEEIFSENRIVIDSVHHEFNDVALIDFDTDGDLDIFAVSQKDSLYYYENLGSLHFESAKKVELSYHAGDLFIEGKGNTLFTQSEEFEHLFLQEFGLFFNGHPTQYLTLYFGESLPGHIRIRDLDGDGVENDLLYYDRLPIGGQIWIQRNYEWPPILVHQAPNYYGVISDVEVGDFNDDGHPDIAVLDLNLWNLSIYLADENCGYKQTYSGYPESMPYPSPYPNDLEIIQSSIDGINQEIILVGTEPSIISRMPIESDGTLSESRPEPNYGCRCLGAINTADFNLDGYADVVGYGQGQCYEFDLSECEEDQEGVNQLFLYSGAQNLLGIESFGSFTWPETNVTLSGNHEGLKSGDLDGDGDIDVVLGARNLQVLENSLLDCSTHESAPVDLKKNYAPVPFSDGQIDRVQLKWYQSSPEIRYTAEDNAACDIEFWPVRDLITGEDLNHLPHSFLEKKTKPGQELWKWPIKFDRPDVMPNTRYKWRVRCYCNAGEGPVSPWSETKFFATPDYDSETGIYEGKLAGEGSLVEKIGPAQFQLKEVKVSQVIVYDLSGQELDRMSINSDSFSTETLASGMYIIQLFSDGAIVGSEKIKID